MIDFFARSAESNLLRSFQFHVPLVLDSPETQVHTEIDDKGFCQLYLHANEKVKICSEFIGDKSAIYLLSTKELKVGPMRSMLKVDAECTIWRYLSDFTTLFFLGHPCGR